MVEGVRRRIALWFGSAWFLALGMLFLVAVWEGQERRQGELDTQLQMRGTFIYGLVWFDDEERLHPEFLDREPWSQEPEYPMRIFDAGPPLTQLWGSPVSESFHAALRPIRDRLTADQEEDWLGDIEGERVHVVAMLANDSLEVEGIAVVSHSLRDLRAAQWIYSSVLFVAFVALAALGIAVAWRLSAMSVEPLEQLYRSRARFLAAAAHELRTPLTTLQVVCESGKAGDEAALKALTRTESIVRNASRRVDTLLWHARLSAGEEKLRRVPTRIDLLVEQVCEAFPAAEHGREAITAKVDVELLTVALTNLLHNAERHAGAKAGKGMRIGLDSRSVWIEDRGPGFSEEILEGSAFRSGHPEGIGFGLEIARMVAHLHGGDLELASGVEGGARVTLRFA